MSRSWWAGLAQLPTGLAPDVRFEITGGRFSAIEVDVEPDGATVLPGVVLPGFADVHGHAFHRALRGRTHGEGGSFWTWRERMYAVAATLTPEGYLELARATYAELALAGVTTVGEFHYLHHGPGGVPYDEPNVMAQALRQAAADAGVRLTLLDACYLRGGLRDEPLNDVQRRFADRTVGDWAERVGTLAGDEVMRIGVAAHSVRAVPRAALRVIASTAAGRPLHIHVSEQPAENSACLTVHGRTPAGLLAAEDLLGPQTVLIHATHLTPADIDVIGRRGAWVCSCPTTEADLADGIGELRALRDAGARVALGSDQHVVADLLAEAQAMEAGERLASLRRGRFRPTELLDALTAHDALGWSDTGRLEVGARADLVAVRTDTPRTAGSDPAQLVMTAGAADVDTVIVDGRVVVSAGTHVLGDVGRLLAAAIEPIWR